MSNTIEYDYWHPAFVGAVEIEFRAWKDDLEYLPEHILNKRPIKIDLLIIKRDKNLFLDNQIGNIFRTYNIMEYKSPERRHHHRRLLQDRRIRLPVQVARGKRRRSSGGRTDGDHDEGGLSEGVV